MSDSHNFSFLAEEFPSLVVHAAKAEGYAHSDPESALMNLRVFAEGLATQICRSAGIYVDRGSNFFGKLEKLSQEGILDETTKDRFHLIRSKGNKASHGSRVRSSDVMPLLRTAFRVSVWFYEGYGDFRKVDRVLDLRFVEPSASPDKKELERKFQALQKEMDAKDAELERLRLEKAQSEEELRKEQEKAKARLKKAIQKKSHSLSEAETRILIDQQIRAAGWIVDTNTLTHKNGTRPEAGKNMAISEWPVHKGWADYALFIGEELYGFVEAKKFRKDIVSDLSQAERYARDMYQVANEKHISPQLLWEKFKVPFIFSTNSRRYNKFDDTKSGIWFRDLRKPTNLARPLDGWFSPDELQDKYLRDIAAANQRLAEDPNSYLTDALGLNLRGYQVKAIEAVEQVVIAGKEKRALLAMATGTGKTRTIMGLCYRLIKSKRFRRILFLVDRSLLGQQAYDSFNEVPIEENQAFGNIYNLGDMKSQIPELETKLHFATVQGMVKRILYPSSHEVPSVGTYDCIIVDEAHRGYTLDRDIDEDQVDYKDQRDFRSKYRMVLEHFDAFQVGLTATPALHTSEIFGPPVFNYSFQQAVVDGWLIDAEPPYIIRTKLSEEGIQFQRGESITVYNTQTQEFKQLDQLEDEIDYEVEEFNKQVITQNFTETVLKQLVRHIDWESKSKTLIFAATDKHADDIVTILKRCYQESGEEIRDDAVKKLTGSVYEVQKLLKLYKNEHYPTFAVTVDLLSTGIDVPEICNLVFMRAVKSRILYEQMLGRATRRADHIQKESFRIFDAVGLYKRMEGFSDMRPVVTQPKENFDKLLQQLGEMQSKEDEAALEIQLKQIIAKFHRKKKRIKGEDLEYFQSQTDGKEPEQYIRELLALEPKEAIAEIQNKAELFRFLDHLSPEEIYLPVSEHQDEVQEIARGYGDHEKPEDYLQSFEDYLEENRSKMEVLQLVCTRPSNLSREDLKKLRLTLKQAGYGRNELRAAWKAAKNEDIAADIIGFIRTLSMGDPLIPVEERVKMTMQKVRKMRNWTAGQEKWLNRIQNHLEKQSILDPIDLEQAPFRDKGGFKKINEYMDNQLDNIINTLKENLFNSEAG